MSRYIALLRGVNVGGHSKVPMAALRATCESIGCTGVTTYIQSGNVVLDSDLDADRLRTGLEAAIAEQLGVAPAVVIRTRERFAEVAAGNPFPEADPGHLHVAFLAEPLDGPRLDSLAELEHPSEELAARGDHVYFRLPDGIGRAKLPELYGRRVKIVTTVRNWRTVLKLLEMSAK